MKSETVAENMPAPDFTLTGSDKNQHTLSDYRGRKVVLYFYPKDNTPGWTKQAESFRDNVSALEEHNAIVIGVSRDTLASHDKFIEKLRLPFILLSDPEAKVCSLYGVLKEKNMYGKMSLGIERTTFIINEQGIVAKIFNKVKVDAHIEEILTYIRTI